MTLFNSTEDERWIAQTLKGDPEAFAPLVQKYHARLFDLATRMLGNRDEAEDALQDVFVEAYRHLADFKHKAQFSTWIYTITLNRIRNRLRHNRVLRWMPLEVSRDGEEYRPLELPEPQPGLEAVAQTHLQMDAVVNTIRTFPLHYQAIFILHYFHNLSLEEVARHVGRPLATVKVYLHRARKLLYKKLSLDEAVTLKEMEVSK